MQTLAKEYSDLNKSPDDEKLAEKIKELRDIGVQLKVSPTSKGIENRRHHTARKRSFYSEGTLLRRSCELPVSP